MASLFSEALDFALTKAGKDSDFKLKTEQKSIIEVFTPFCQDCNFPKEFPANFRRTSSQSRVTWISLICFNLSARFSFIPSFPKLLIALQ